jgi:hypothetical protein
MTRQRTGRHKSDEDQLGALASNFQQPLLRVRRVTHPDWCAGWLVTVPDDYDDVPSDDTVDGVYRMRQARDDRKPLLLLERVRP